MNIRIGPAALGWPQFYFSAPAGGSGASEGGGGLDGGDPVQAPMSGGPFYAIVKPF